MSSRKWQRLFAPAMVVTALTAAANGCSSSSNSMPAADAGDMTPADASSIPRGRHPDGSALDTGVTPAPDASAVAPFDGTTGNACKSNADCKGTSADAPGTNVCSNSYTFTIPPPPAPGGVSVQLWPTPVCLMPLAANTGNCDPGPAGQTQFCDSASVTDLTSRGICLPATNPQQPGPTNGVCFPACTFGLDGTAATGCPGKDTCLPITFILDPTTNKVTGYGACQGTCQSDADCTALGATWGCQQDLGFCTRTKKARSKPLGTACTNAGTTTDTTAGACNCFSLSSVTAAYCTSACVTGGTCANGWVCDSLETSTLTFTGAAADGGDLVVPGPATQTPGLVGTCMPPCNPAADGGAAGPAEAGSAEAAAGEAGTVEAGGGDGGNGEAASPAQVPDASSTQCLPLTTCISGTVAGPDCQPM